MDLSPIEERVRSVVADGHAPGLALATVAGDEVVYAGGFGPTSVEPEGVDVTPTTLFDVGSRWRRDAVSAPAEATGTPRWLQRVVGVPVGRVPRATLPAVADLAELTRLVHEAYAHLYDRAFLREHPLTALLAGVDGAAADRLHRILLEAVEELRPIRPLGPAAVEWRRYRHLRARYHEGASPETIARELGVSERQARRDHVEALDQVARLLWRRLGPAAGSGPAREPAEAGPSLHSETGLDAELTKIAASGSPPTDLAETLRGVVDTLGRLASSNRVELRLDLPAALPPAAANRTVLRQLLINLLSDAIARHPGGAVGIGARPTDDAVVLELTFPGQPEHPPGQPEHPPGRPGAPPHPGADEPAVLELAGRLARSQGIEIDEDARAPEARRLSVRVPRAALTTLLLVDDNPDVALLFRRFLGGSSYRIVQARSAERALRLARELQPDVVFLDVLMPLADGWEILQALRADPTTADLRVVICSVLPDAALAGSLGVTELLAKPVTRAALLALMRGEERQARP
ncbi:MAG TPA: response regulator [Chloroflexota bacterium]